MKKIFNYIILLAVGAITLTGCDSEDQYIADQLRNRDWEGYIGTYYQDRWGISGTEYATLWRFRSSDPWATSGRGDELNYNTRSPRYDYAYATFKWFIVDGEITLLYDDNKWQPIYIVDYGLNSDRFFGYIYDGSSRNIKFDMVSSTFSDWDYYRRSGYGGYNYGDFQNQRYFYSRQADLDADSIPVIDRTEQVRQESGESDAYSIVSGAFARGMNY